MEGSAVTADAYRLQGAAGGTGRHSINQNPSLKTAEGSDRREQGRKDELLQSAAAPRRRPSTSGLSGGGVRQGRIPAFRVPSRGLPAARVSAPVRPATAAAAAARAFLPRRMFGRSLLLLPFGCLLLRRDRCR